MQAKRIPARCSFFKVFLLHFILYTYIRGPILPTRKLPLNQTAWGTHTHLNKSHFIIAERNCVRGYRIKNGSVNRRNEGDTAHTHTLYISHMHLHEVTHLSTTSYMH